MKTITVLLLVVLISAAQASVGHIDNAKAQECSTGTCIDVCSYDGLKMLPGTEISDDGKCRRVRCLRDFSMQING